LFSRLFVWAQSIAPAVELEVNGEKALETRRPETSPGDIECGWTSVAAESRKRFVAGKCRPSHVPAALTDGSVWLRGDRG
jgi:hypothetical protein